MLDRSASVLARRPVLTGVLALLVTALLAIPLMTMTPTSSASAEPDGPAFDARDLLAERLAPQNATNFLLVEASGAAASVDAPPDAPTDVLEPTVLRELLRRSEAVRSEFADVVVTVTDPVTELDIVGLLTPADVIDDALAAAGGLATAPDDVVRATTTRVVESVGPTALGLSTAAYPDADGTWHSPAFSTILLLDNELLGGGLGGATLGTDDLTREQTIREIRDVLRGGAPGDDVTRDAAGPLLAHAVAADANLTAAEQGEAAGPFIGLVVLLTVLLVGLVFRSYWHLAIVGSGIAALMVWLNGLSNLVGLEQDQILSTIVPIALVSFGVDFAFHAFGRVREEREAGRTGGNALRYGLAGVGGALLLALASDSAAFLSNTMSGIESIVQFGIAATLGLASAFLLLGVVAPTVEQAVAERVAPPTRGIRSTVLRVLAGIGAASVAMGAVLMTVYVSAPIGVVLTLLHPVLFVVLPAHLRAADRVGGAAAARAHVGPTLHDGVVARRLGAGTLAVARRGAIVLPVAGLVTAVALVGALQVETAFDVEDFFSAETDFVAALNALDDHVGETGGEPTPLVVTTDLTSPAAVSRLASEVDELRTARGPFARTEQGEVLVDGGVVDLVRDAVTVPSARAAVESTTGIVLTDSDGDGVPDDPEALAAIYEVATTRGLPLDEQRLLWAPSQVVEVLDLGAGAELDATRLQLQLPGSREVSVVQEAAEILDPRMIALTSDLDALARGSDAQATGAPITRQRSLDAVTQALLLSLPIAILACFLVALVAMRSLRFASIAIVPILLVVPWLYGLMALLGYEVNLVTGTIGAISIGIGIDFAIHLVERFREERGRLPDRDDALRATAEGTGLALVASAGSSIIGFLVLSFAPMPMFASYGLLTAIMIAMALVATLLVLPALLRATTRPLPEQRTTIVRIRRPELVGS